MKSNQKEYFIMYDDKQYKFELKYIQYSRQKEVGSSKINKLKTENNIKCPSSKYEHKIHYYNSQY